MAAAAGEAQRREVHRLLAGDVVAGAATAHADRLQPVFGLGYGEYIALVRDAFTPAVERAGACAANGRWGAGADRARCERALAEIRTV